MLESSGMLLFCDERKKKMLVWVLFHSVHRGLTTQVLGGRNTTLTSNIRCVANMLRRRGLFCHCYVSFYLTSEREGLHQYLSEKIWDFLIGSSWSCRIKRHSALIKDDKRRRAQHFFSRWPHAATYALASLKKTLLVGSQTFNLSLTKLKHAEWQNLFDVSSNVSQRYFHFFFRRVLQELLFFFFLLTFYR